MADGGYLLIDNRAAGGTKTEQATETCCHCNRIVLLNPARTRERNYCRKCDHYVCDKAGCILNCIPMQQVIDIAARFPNQPHLLYDASGHPLVASQVFDRFKVY